MTDQITIEPTSLQESYDSWQERERASEAFLVLVEAERVERSRKAREMRRRVNGQASYEI